MSNIITFSRTFNFVGAVEEFVCPFSGLYKLQVKGGQGGSSIENGQLEPLHGGRGGISVGYIVLKKDQSLYVCVGGAGKDGRLDTTQKVGSQGGYNGGGKGISDTWDETEGYEAAGGGGGATHIATYNRGVLSNYEYHREEILLVAGGGGGQAWNWGAGEGGGPVGGKSVSGPHEGPTQDSGYAFGKGEDAFDTDATRNKNGVGGGGGGWYGGYINNQGEFYTSGTGGSGYIGGVPDVTYKSSTYTSTMYPAQNEGDGSAIIELLIAEPEPYKKCVCSCQMTRISLMGFVGLAIIITNSF